MYDKIERYKVLELIGEGAMAEVFKVYDPDMDCNLALKILKDEWCGDNHHENRFLRDARALSSIPHPNIATVHNFGKIDNRPYMVMELLRGSLLEECIDAGQPAPLERVLSWGIQISEALHFVHIKKIYHRDIKPSNILMDSHSDRIKITDFGIASNRQIDATSFTQHGMVLGTPQYMSPEQWKGQQVDGRADLFAVGVILYRLCSGKKPFDGETMETLAYQITQTDPPPIEEVAKDIPVGMRHIIEKLLMKLPEQRFENGESLAAALRHELKRLQEEKSEQSKYIPLKVRWTILMGILVTLTSAISIYFIESRQKDALTALALDSGNTLEKIVANVSKQDLLKEEWASVDIFAKKTAMGEKVFEYLFILDNEGVVRGAGDNRLLGNPYNESFNMETIYEKGSTKVTETNLSNGQKILDFSVPIQNDDDDEVGRVHLGLLRETSQASPGKGQLDAILNSGIQFVDSAANSSLRSMLSSEDWVSVDTFVKKAALEENAFQYLFILDDEGVVRGAGDNRFLSNPYKEPSNVENVYEDGKMEVTEIILDNGKVVLDLNAPIKFSNTKVGSVRLGLLREPLDDIVKSTRGFLFVLAIVILLVASCVLYFLSRSLSWRIRSLRSAMNEIEMGNFACRISETTNDELGETFLKFNKMAASLQERITHEIVTRPKQ
jgi:serine/threonine protein kinase/HAMP domain-containing protein